MAHRHSPAAGSSCVGQVGRGEKASDSRHFLWLGGTEIFSVGRAAQQGKRQGRKQCLSQQMSDRARVSTMRLSTVGQAVVFQTKKRNHKVLLLLALCKTHLLLPLELGPEAYYL